MKICACLAACVVLMGSALARAGDIEFATYQQIEEVPAGPGQPEGATAGQLKSELEDGLADTPDEAACCVPPKVSGDVVTTLNAGAGVYFISPRWTSNPGIFSGGGGGFGAGGNTQRDVSDLNFGINGAPYVWAEMGSTSGLGIRAQWFSYSGHSGTASVFTDGNPAVAASTPVILGAANSVSMGGSLTAQGRLAINVIDFEATGTYALGATRLTLSGGVRYAHLAQGFNSTAIDAAGATSVLNASHNFNGVGPTVAALVHRSMQRHPSVGMYARARGALLFGSQEAQASQFAAIDEFDVMRGRTTLPVTELEVGLDWRRDYPNIGFFLQTGFIAQAYFGAGNSANSTTLAFPAGTTVYTADTSTLGLLGLRLTGGFSY